jgi:hypothetical protein
MRAARPPAGARGTDGKRYVTGSARPRACARPSTRRLARADGTRSGRRRRGTDGKRYVTGSARLRARARPPTRRLARADGTRFGRRRARARAPGARVAARADPGLAVVRARVRAQATAARRDPSAAYAGGRVGCARRRRAPRAGTPHVSCVSQPWPRSLEAVRDGLGASESTRAAVGAPPGAC